MARRIAERELLRSRRRVSRSGLLLGLLGLLIGLPLRLALLGGLLPSGIGGGGDLLLGGDGAEGDENNSGKSSGDRADHRETPEACAGRIPGAIGVPSSKARAQKTGANLPGVMACRIATTAPWSGRACRTAAGVFPRRCKT